MHVDGKDGGEEQPHRVKSRSRRGFRILAYFGYLIVAVAGTYQLALGIDWLVGYFLPISPFPPRSLGNQPLADIEFKTYDFECKYRTNSMGLRGEEVPPKSKEVFRILVIGSSPTFGWGVNEEDIWPERLKQMICATGRRVEVVNGSIPGLGPVEYARRAECLVPDVRPDLVLIGTVAGTDLLNTPAHMVYFTNIHMLVTDFFLSGPPPARGSSEPGRPEQHQQHAIESAKKIYENMPADERSRFDRLDSTVKENFFKGLLNVEMIGLNLKDPYVYAEVPKENDDRKMRVLTSTLVRIRRITERYGARLVVAMLPDGPWANHAALVNWRRLGFEIPEELYGNTCNEEFIQTACKKASVVMYNIAAVFRQHGEEPDLYYVLDTHLAPAGHRLVAESLFPLLLDQLPPVTGVASDKK